jgi:hypothetical protein
MHIDPIRPPASRGLSLPAPTDLFRARPGEWPAALTASATVVIGFGLAVALIVAGHGLVAPLVGWVGVSVAIGSPPAALTVLGGLCFGTGLAAHVLHRQHARPLAGVGAGACYRYTVSGRRRMATGLVSAYLTAAALVLLVATATGAQGELAGLLAY